jgi:hypothetical protein
VRKSRIFLFVAVQLIAFGATFAITQTIGTRAFTFRRVNTERTNRFSFCIVSRQLRSGFPSSSCC